MNAIHKLSFAVLLPVCAVGLPMFFGAIGAAQAAEPRPCLTTYRTSLDTRLAAKADTGADALRQFVTRTRMIYQLDMAEALARVDAYRATQRACEEAAARRSDDMSDE